VNAGLKIRRALTVGVCGVCLIALGLVLMGRDGEALRAFQRLSGPQFVLEPLPGSRTEPVRQVYTSTGSELVQMCRSERSVGQIVAAYEKIAASQAMQLSRSLAPYIKQQEGHMGMVTWIDHKGRRLGVVAFPLVANRSSRYVLFQAGAASIPTESTPTLPLGIQAPNGSRSLFDIRQTNQSMSYCQIPGSPDKVLREFQQRLVSAGCEIDSNANRILLERGQGRGLVSLRFEKGKQIGYLTLKPGDSPGSTDMSLIVHNK
jgi:hypothetical protein